MPAAGPAFRSLPGGLEQALGCAAWQSHAEDNRDGKRGP
jgi:hypothetical protein